MPKLSGGDKLEKALAAIGKNINKASSVDIGFLEDATYPDGQSVALVAFIQEFGAPNAKIPPRPFFRTMIQDKSPGWPKAIADNLKQNNYDADKTLDQAGAGIAGQLQQSIIDIVEPPLSQTTLMLRKMRADNPDLVVTGKTVGEAAARVAAGKSYGGVSTKPLVDSSKMLHSVDWVVK